MIEIQELTSKVGKTIKTNAPEILTGLGVTGVLTTSYLVARGSFAAAHKLESQDPSESVKEKTKRVWKCYIPAAASAAVTIACIVGSSKSSASRTAAAVTAYSITEKAFSEYKEQVVKEIGKNKEQGVRDVLAQQAVIEAPQGSKEVIVIGTGNVLCCELYTKRYFRSDMESLRKAENALNAQLVGGTYVYLSDFYELLGIPYTSNSSNVGWEVDRLMELDFSTVISEDGEPCLAFDYNYVKPLK